MTKKKISGKGKIVKIFRRLWTFFRKQREIWNRGNASWPKGGWTPL